MASIPTVLACQTCIKGPLYPIDGLGGLDVPANLLPPLPWLSDGVFLLPT